MSQELVHYAVADAVALVQGDDTPEEQPDPVVHAVAGRYLA